MKLRPLAYTRNATPSKRGEVFCYSSCSLRVLGFENSRYVSANKAAICIQIFSAQTLAEHLFPKSILYFIQGIIHSCSIRSPSYEGACTPQIDPKTIGLAKERKKCFGRINLLMTGDKMTCNYFLSSDFYNDS